MNIGIPKEHRPFEYRTGLSPVGVRVLTEAGNICYVERGTGLGAGFSDEDYVRAGAKIVYTCEEVFGRAKVILKVSRPTAQEIGWMVPEQVLMGYLNLSAAHPSKVDALLAKKVTAIAYEQIRLPDGTHPVLKPLSQIGGRMSAHLAASLLQNNHKSKGVLLGGVAGVAPAEVVVVGGGVAGEAAAKAFLGLGAHVTILDKDLSRLQELAEIFRDQVVTLLAYPFHILRACSYADVVIGAIMVAGERSPVILPRPVFQKMRPGSVFIDLSIDHGGCAETSRPTSHDDPTYVEMGVIHCCIPNLPGVVARTATHAFLNAAGPYIESIVSRPAAEAIAADPSLAAGVVTFEGELRNHSTISYEKK
ncbi:MAG: alanine dehydrogenase [Thermoanaerobaculia bacterium]|nr:Alanine dehydrogenase [Thermoanaerobaculia bacterium]MCK6683335.1 alanine dehydrogenase [Thermoanaerobaculia bacterium]